MEREEIKETRVLGSSGPGALATRARRPAGIEPRGRDHKGTQPTSARLGNFYFSLKTIQSAIGGGWGSPLGHTLPVHTECAARSRERGSVVQPCPTPRLWRGASARWTLPGSCAGRGCPPRRARNKTQTSLSD